MYCWSLLKRKVYNFTKCSFFDLVTIYDIYYVYLWHVYDLCRLHNGKLYHNIENNKSGEKVTIVIMVIIILEMTIYEDLFPTWTWSTSGSCMHILENTDKFCCPGTDRGPLGQVLPTITPRCAWDWFPKMQWWAFNVPQGSQCPECSWNSLCQFLLEKLECHAYGNHSWTTRDNGTCVCVCVLKGKRQWGCGQTNE